MSFKKKVYNKKMINLQLTSVTHYFKIRMKVHYKKKTPHLHPHSNLKAISLQEKWTYALINSKHFLFFIIWLTALLMFIQVLFRIYTYTFDGLILFLYLSSISCIRGIIVVSYWKSLGNFDKNELNLVTFVTLCL